MSPITELVLQSTWETVVMVFFSTLFAILLGFPLSRVVLGTALGLRRRLFRFPSRRLLLLRA